MSILLLGLVLIRRLRLLLCMLLIVMGRLVWAVLGSMLMVLLLLGVRLSWRFLSGWLWLLELWLSVLRCRCIRLFWFAAVLLMVALGRVRLTLVWWFIGLRMRLILLLGVRTFWAVGRL